MILQLAQIGLVLKFGHLNYGRSFLWMTKITIKTVSMKGNTSNCTRLLMQNVREESLPKGYDFHSKCTIHNHHITLH